MTTTREIITLFLRLDTAPEILVIYFMSFHVSFLTFFLSWLKLIQIDDKLLLIFNIIRIPILFFFLILVDKMDAFSNYNIEYDTHYVWQLIIVPGFLYVGLLYL